MGVVNYDLLNKKIGENEVKTTINKAIEVFGWNDFDTEFLKSIREEVNFLLQNIDKKLNELSDEYSNHLLNGSESEIALTGIEEDMKAHTDDYNILEDRQLSDYIVMYYFKELQKEVENRLSTSNNLLTNLEDSLH